MTNNELGAWGENLASTYLTQQGWTILSRNWRTRGGEIDIVGFDPLRNAIVAVEVKTRRTHRAGTPAEAVTALKVKRIKSLLLQWLLDHRSFGTQIGVDVVTVDLSGDHHDLTHLKGVES